MHPCKQFVLLVWACVCTRDHHVLTGACIGDLSHSVKFRLVLNMALVMRAAKVSHQDLPSRLKLNCSR